MAAQQQGQSADNSLAPLWIMILVFIVLGIIWYFFSAQIIWAIFQVKLFEIYLVSFFSDGLTKVKEYIQNASYSEVTVNQLTAVSAAVGNYLRYAFAPILFITGLFLLLRSSDFRFRTVYNMKKLFSSEVKNWPQIAPVMNVDLVKTDIDKGPWAMALTPMQFAKKHKLLKEERKSLTEGMLLRHQRKTVTVMRGAAHRVFSLQLGKRWQGIEKLSPHIQALFAIFAAKGNGDDKSARKLLSQISASTKSGQLDYSGKEKLLEKYGNSKAVEFIIQQHGYIFTVMASMLQFARSDGVLATADFLWLKPVDRTLWYILNMVGRQTSLSEVGGIFAHWLSEKEIGHKLAVPMVDEAVKALELAIQEVIYIPDEEDKGN